MSKILFLAAHVSTGGLPQYLYKKLQLLQNEHETHVIIWEDIAPVFNVQRNRISNLLGDRFKILGPNKQDELFSYIEKIQPDIIHLEEIPEMWLYDKQICMKLYHKDRKYKIVETTHDSSFDINQKLFFPDKFAFVSRWSIKQFEPLGIPMELVEYPIEYQIRPNREETLKELGLDPTKKHILNVGLWTSRKNQAEVIKYAQMLINEDIEFHFVGNQADNFKWYWEPLMHDLPNNCKVWGERHDVDKFYASMDLFLFTSLGREGDKETNPLVIKEALSWQIPTLLYDLDVYLGQYDNNEMIKYLNFDDIIGNKNIILDTLNASNVDISTPMTVDQIWDISRNKYEIQQKPQEWKPFIDLLQQWPKETRLNVLEIGTCNGGTTSTFCNLFDNVTSISLDSNSFLEKLQSEYSNWEFIQGHSQSKKIIEFIKSKNIKYDLIFIDGDHSAEGVKRDFNSYKSLIKPTGYIVFHDILDTEFHRTHDCFVYEFWNKIKTIYDSQEIIDIDPNKNDNVINAYNNIWGGLGILKNINIPINLGDNDLDTIKKLNNAVDLSYLGISDLDESILNIEGMSSSKVRHFLNNIIKSFNDIRYLEVGLLKGSTFISSLYKNKIKLALGVDNFSEFDGTKEELLSNIKKYLSDDNIQFIESDYKKIDYAQFPKFNVYFYDGNHSKEEQYYAITTLNNHLENKFICIVDDWNWSDVQEGTFKAFNELKYKIIYEQFLPASYAGDTDNWWNGFYIAYIEKPNNKFIPDDILNRYRIIENKNDDYVNEIFPATNRLFGLKDLLDYHKINETHTAIEIGSYAGSSSQLIAQYVKKLYCCDVWGEYIQPIERSTMVKNAFYQIHKTNPNIEVINEFSSDAKKHFSGPTFDFVYIDADHSYDSVKADILTWLTLVKCNGVISGHDYFMPEVRRAVDEIFGDKMIKYFGDSSWSVIVDEQLLQKYIIYNPITVIIPTYQRTSTLTEAIDSVLDQNYPNVNILVCHDGPSEEYDQFSQTYKNIPNVHFYNTPTHQGFYGVNARNMMTAICPQDQHIIYLDDDNILYDNALLSINNSINKGASLVVSKIDLDGFGWYNLTMPTENNIQHRNIDTLNICISSNIAKLFDWDKIDIAHDFRFIKKCEEYCLLENKPIIYNPDFIGRHRLSTSEPIFIFSHNYLTNDWRTIVSEQCKKIIQSDLSQNLDRIFFYVIDKDNSYQEFCDLISSYFTPSTYSIIKLEDNKYEFETLSGLKLLSKYYKHARYLYIHTKGVVSAYQQENNKDAVIQWRHVLEDFNINKWQFCIDKLQEGFDVVGTYYFQGDNGLLPIFAGNFFWITGEYLRQLADLSITTDRGNCENWIFTKNPKYYSNQIPTNKDLYHFINADTIPVSNNDEIFIVTSHPNYKATTNITSECIQALKNTGKKVILATHCPIEKELQELCDYSIYDKNNPFIQHDFYNTSWFNDPNYFAQLNIAKYDNNLNHAAACHNNIWNGIALAKELGYKKAICLNFDIILSQKDSEFFDKMSTRMDSENKQAYFMNTKEQEGLTLKTIFFVVRPEYFLQKFPYMKNGEFYQDYIKSINSETNCLENVYYNTLKNNLDDLILEETTEEKILQTSKVNLFSMIEYFTILPVENKDNTIVVWYSSSNKVDSRFYKINIWEHTTEDFKRNILSLEGPVSKDFRLYHELELDRNTRHTIELHIYEGQSSQKIKTKEIILEPKDWISLHENGIFKYY